MTPATIEEVVTLITLAKMLFAPLISPLAPTVVIPLAVMLNIVFPATFAIILPFAPEKKTLLVPLLMKEPVAVIAAFVTAVTRPFAATVTTGIAVVPPYVPAVILTLVTSVFATAKAEFA